jgi:fatty acid desaturase
MEAFRLLTDRGAGQAKLDELHARIAAAAEEGQQAMEKFVRAELAAQIAALRAELDARQESLRRDIRRLAIGLGVAMALVAAAAAVGLGWFLHRP